MKKNAQKTAVLLFYAVIIIAFLCSCSGKTPKGTVLSANDLPGKTVGVMSGTVTEKYVSAYSGKMTVKSYSDVSAMARELSSGGLDLIVSDSNMTGEIISSSTGLKKLDTPFINRAYCIAVSQENKTLRKNVNDALRSMGESGELSKIVSGWLKGEYEAGYTANDAADKLMVAVAPDFYPYAYLDDNGNVCGMEPDIINGICTYLGLCPEFYHVSADKVVYMAECGKVSLAIGRVSDIGSEVLYSEPYMTVTQDIIVRKG